MYLKMGSVISPVVGVPISRRNPEIDLLKSRTSGAPYAFCLGGRVIKEAHRNPEGVLLIPFYVRSITSIMPNNTLDSFANNVRETITNNKELAYVGPKRAFIKGKNLDVCLAFPNVEQLREFLSQGEDDKYFPVSQVYDSR